MKKIRQLLMVGIVAIMGLGTNGLHAQGYPDRPVKIVVPFAPGGGADMLARTLSPVLSEKWGQPVVVENRAGASGNIGAEVVAKADPDGYTILLTSSAFVINPGMMDNLPFNVQNDFTPLTLAVELPNVLVIHPSVKANSVDELVAVIKSDPSAFSYASPGNGTGGHLVAELFKQSIGVDIVHIPYKGGGAVIADLLAGRVPMTFATLPSVMQYISTGQLRPLALTTGKRAFIEVPTMIEVGFAGFDLSTWLGFLGPANMPAPVVQKLSSDLIAVMKSPAVSEMLKKQGMLEVASTPAQFAQKITNDLTIYRDIIQKSGAKRD